MVHTGLSGNEIYCLQKVGYKPGNILIGNSVFSMGFLGGVRSNLRSAVGGEIKQYTEMIAEGRRLSLQRLEKEVTDFGAIGATGITNELVMHPENIEFLSVGSALHTDAEGKSKFTSAADGQELYCQIDAGYEPVSFVFGNVAYSIGIGKSFLGGLRTLVRGEIPEYTNIFTHTRNLALERIQKEAKSAGANVITEIKTTIIPFKQAGVQEMLMLGTASKHDGLPQDQVATCDLTCQELWNMTELGYIPMKLMLGTSVYSLGVAGSIGSTIRGFFKGEINQLTTLIYEAREKSLGKITAEAKAIGADDIIGIQTYIYSLGSGLIEFLAIGTAMKYVGNTVTTKSHALIPQAIIRDIDTFCNTADMSFGYDLSKQVR